MAVSSCKLIRKGMRGSLSSKIQGTYQHKWLVKAEKDDGPAVVLAQSQLVGPDQVPVMWSPYSLMGGTDTSSYLQEVTAEPTNQDEANWNYWEVTGRWSPPPQGQSGPTQPNPTNPLLDPVIYGGDFTSYVKGIFEDKDGNPLLNSAGDPFENVEIEDEYPVLIATKNMWPLGYIMSIASSYKNAVNTNVFYGAGPREAKVESIIPGRLQERAGIQYYPVTFRIQFNDQKWDLKMVDRGTQAYDKDKADPTAKKRRVRVLTNSPDDEGPQKGDLLDIANLNPDGTQRADDADPPGLFVTYRVYPEKNFAALGI